MAKYLRTKEQWDIVAVMLKRIVSTYTTDKLLVEYAQNMLNNMDSRLNNSEEVSQLTEVIYNVLSDENYYKNVHLHTSKEEKEFLANRLAPELELLLNLAKAEEAIQQEEPKMAERLPNINKETSVFDVVNFKDRIL